MITVTINRPKNEITGFTVKGHAQFNPYGIDIVCSAVSALTQTTLLGLGTYIPALDYSMSSGDLECKLPELDEINRIRAGAILETMVVGLKNIEQNYPGHVEVI